jgi:tape measure domain-containing protein
MAGDLETLTVRMEAQFRSFEREMQRTRAVTDRQTKAIADKFSGLNQQVEKSMGSLGGSASAGLAKFSGVLAAGFSVNKIMELSDAFTNATNKIKAAGLDGAALKPAQDAITRIADESRTSFGTVSDLYAKLTRSSKDLGASQADVATVTSTVSKALKLSGASAGESESAILQLGQALQSGSLQGDELRSLLENAPLLAQAIATEFGVAVGELKNLGANGELAAGRVFQALVKAAPQVDAAFATTKATFADMWVGFQNALLGFVGALQQAISASPAYVQALSEVEGKLNAARLAQEGFNSAAEKAGQAQTTSRATGLKSDLEANAAEIRNLQTQLGALIQDVEKFGAIGIKGDEKQEALRIVARAMTGTKEETIAAAVELQKMGDANPSFANVFSGINSVIKALGILRSEAASTAATLANMSYGPQQPAPQTPFKIDRSKIIADDQVMEATSESIAKGLLNDQIVNSKLDDSAKKVVAKQKELRDMLNKQGIGAPSNLNSIASQIVSNEDAASGGGKSGKSDAEKSAAKSATEVKHFADELNKTLDPTIEYNRQIDLLFAAMERGIIPANQAAEAMALIGERTLEAGNKAAQSKTGFEEQFKSMEATINAVGSKFGDTLGDLATGGKVSFTDLANSIIKDLIRIMTQMLIVKPIIQSLQSSLGASLGIPSIGGAGLGHRASGGPVQSGRTYLVGENGPEMVRFGKNGTVVPNAAVKNPSAAAGASQSAVPITISVVGARGNSEIQQMVAAGVSSGLKAYDQRLPSRISDINVRYS